MSQAKMEPDYLRRLRFNIACWPVPKICFQASYSSKRHQNISVKRYGTCRSGSTLSIFVAVLTHYTRKPWFGTHIVYILIDEIHTAGTPFVFFQTSFKSCFGDYSFLPAENAVSIKAARSQEPSKLGTGERRYLLSFNWQGPHFSVR